MRADSGPYIAADILHACEGTIVRGNPDLAFDGITTDSRDIKENDLFVPLVGPTFDGHDFLIPALEAGARGSLLHRDINRDIPNHLANRVLIQVQDTLQALTSLASAFRYNHTCPLIAVTGSSGKTTVKEMIASILQRSHIVLASEANFNNLIGLPMTVLNLNSKHTAAVVEAGINIPGEMRYLAKAALPDVAVITSIGPVHLEGLHSIENVATEKFDLARALPANGTAILPEADSYLKRLIPECRARVLFFGLGRGDLRAEDLSFDGITRFNMITPSGKFDIEMHVPGHHNVENALAAAGASLAIGATVEDVQEGIKLFRPPRWRMEMIPLPQDRTLIRDCYNANPQSVKAALHVLSDTAKGGRTMALLADMKELGEKSGELHELIGEYTVRNGIDRVVFVGNEGNRFSRGFTNAGGDIGKLLVVKDKTEAFEAVKDELFDYSAILVKGSRAMKMEILADKILGEQ